MSQKFILAGVGTFEGHSQDTGDLILTSKTLVDSGINFSVTEEEIRGGLANAKLGSYFHDSALALTLTDALFSLDMLSMQLGSTISVGTDVRTIEQVAVTDGKVTVSLEPQKFGSFGVIGWVSKAGSDDWTTITFDVDTKSAIVPESTFAEGDSVCVKYYKEDVSAEQFTVSSAFIPSQIYGVLTLPLFKAGTEAQSFSSSSKVGEVQIEIPNFLFNGNVDLSLTSSGASTTPLSGNALATFTGNDSCESNEGYYAKLKQITYNKDEFADVKAIVVADANLELKPNEAQTLQVYAIYSGTRAPRLLDNTKLTFTSNSVEHATVDTNGIVTAQAQGEATIEILVKSKSTLTTAAVVTVESV